MTMTETRDGMTGARPRIRPFEYADLATLDRMVTEIAAHHGDAAAHTPTTLLRDVTGAAPLVTVLMAELEGAPRGFAGLAPLVQLPFGRRGTDLHMLWVDAGWRGRGLGHALVEAARQRARDMGSSYMVVGTHPDNAAAQAWYAARGFEEVPPRGARFRVPL